MCLEVAGNHRVRTHVSNRLAQNAFVSRGIDFTIYPRTTSFASFRQRVTADNEFLRLGSLEFYPGTTAPTAFVE